MKQRIRVRLKPLESLSLSAFTSEVKQFDAPQYIGQILYIKPTMIVSVPEFYPKNSNRSDAQKAAEKHLKKNAHNSEISAKAAKKIKDAVNWLYFSAVDKTVFLKEENKTFSFKVNLITLTMPDSKIEVDGKAFKKDLLQPFLDYGRKTWDLKNYVWKLEYHKSGKIHCHLTTDVFIHHQKIKNYWNSLMAKKGLMKEFAAVHGHSDPNSTDVHACWKVEDLGAYIAKYMSKQLDSENEMKGRIWGCSYSLSSSNKCSMFVPRTDCREELAPLMNPNIEFKKLEQISKKTKLPMTIGELFFIKKHQWDFLSLSSIGQAFSSHCANIRSGLANIANHVLEDIGLFVSTIVEPPPPIPMLIYTQSKLNFNT